MALRFTDGTFIASTTLTTDKYPIYVYKREASLWTFTLYRDEAMKLTAEQANLFVEDMRRENKVAMVEPI